MYFHVCVIVLFTLYGLFFPNTVYAKTILINDVNNTPIISNLTLLTCNDF